MALTSCKQTFSNGSLLLNLDDRTGERVVVKESITTKFGQYDAMLAELTKKELLREGMFLDIMNTNKAAVALEDPHTKVGISIQKFYSGGELFSHINTLKSASDFRDVWTKTENVMNNLHAKGIVHFDMHSSNVMLAKVGAKTEFVPIDFGRAVLTAGLQDGGDLKNYLQNGDKIIAMGAVRAGVERSVGKYEGL